MKIALPLLLFLALFLNSTAPAGFIAGREAGTKLAGGAPRNIILVIGNGMGLTQVSAGMFINGNKLNLEKFPVVGLQKPYSADNLAPDAAAGATALACGAKAFNGALGLNTNNQPTASILTEAKARGMATGMVTSSSITSPVPAAFIAHVRDYNQVENIAASFLDAEVGLLIGGGKDHFSRRNSDGRILYQELEKKGYYISDYSREELSEISPPPEKNFIYFTADEEPPPAAKGRDYLPLASGLAARFLAARAGQAGFFLMIDGAQIGRGGQANDSDYIISEMIDLDKAIGEALHFAEKDGNTLVIVTGSHEAGGYAINPGSRMDTIFPAFTTAQPTAALLPAFAYGPGAGLFNGMYENTAIYTKMKQALGWGR